MTWENLDYVRPEWLDQDHIVGKLKLFVLDVCDSDDYLSASDAFYRIHQLVQSAPDLPTKASYIYREYLQMLAVLKATFLPLLSESDIAAFMKTDLVFALEVQDIDVLAKINNLLLIHKGFSEGESAVSSQLLQALEQNAEFLGIEPIEVKGTDATQNPVVANWLTDYKQFVGTPPQRSMPQRIGAAERIAYISQSPNAHLLNEDQKIILRRLLEIFDWLRSAKNTYTSELKPGRPSITNPPMAPPPNLGSRPAPQRTAGSSYLPVSPPPAPVPPPAAPIPVPEITPRPALPKSADIKPPINLSMGVGAQSVPQAGGHRLEDVLEHVHLRVEAGLPVSEDDTRAIIEIIKTKQKS